MGTSRFDLHIESATDEEAAAIATAIDAHLGAEAAAVTEEGDDSWHGRRWLFRGRIHSLQHRTIRVPLGAPTNQWAAAGRSDRY